MQNMHTESIKIMCLSDTHGTHSKKQNGNQGFYDFTDIDIFIYAGDFTDSMDLNSTDDFFVWLISLPVPIKILVAGNHDICLDPYKSTIDKYLDLFKNNGIIYLNNNSVDIDVRNRTLKVWGSPDTFRTGYSEYEKRRGFWAFGYTDDKDVHNVPKDADIVITHEPPYDILDKSNGHNFGSKKLLEKVMQRSDLSRNKLHVFGHIHKSNGQFVVKNGITFVNATSPDIDDSYIVVEM